LCCEAAGSGKLDWLVLGECVVVLGSGSVCAGRRVALRSWSVCAGRRALYDYLSILKCRIVQQSNFSSSPPCGPRHLCNS
jgi:hypothetical protein